MAEDEDSAQDERSEEIGINAAFKPEGQFCRLFNGARHPSGASHVVTPPNVKRELVIRRRKLDAEFWQHAIEKLDRATKTGKVSRRLASQLVTVLRQGCAGHLPASWVRLELADRSSSVVLPDLRDQRLGAAMYRLAVKRKHIFDPAPAKTIIDRCGIDERTWDDWSAWLSNNYEFVATELEMLLLGASFLLEDLEDFGCALLIRSNADR